MSCIGLVSGLQISSQAVQVKYKAQRALESTCSPPFLAVLTSSGLTVYALYDSTPELDLIRPLSAQMLPSYSTFRWAFDLLMQYEHC